VSRLPPIVDQFRAARRDPELAVLEGFHPVKHALRFGAQLSTLVGTDADEVQRLTAALAPDLRGRLVSGLRLVEVEVFSQLAPQAPRTGVMAIARRPAVDLEAVLGDLSPRPIVLLENPRNLANLGACVRVAAAADAAGLLTQGGQDPWNPEALRGAAGLHFALPVSRVPAAVFPGRPVIAIDPEGEAFAPTRLPPRAVLAFGTERYGLSDQVLEAADQRLSIPMRAGVSSLNLATSVAAILYGWRLAGDHDADDG
jgi:RNA methyltransferase, TrmH family